MALFQKAAEELDREYQVFLGYLERNPVKLSARSGHIGKTDCFNLNQRLQIVVEPYQSAGKTQPYYAVIDFFYFFSLHSGILRLVKARGKGLHLQKTSRYDDFAAMTVMERYVLMLAVWLGEYQEALERKYDFIDIDTILNMMNAAASGEALGDTDSGPSPPYWGVSYNSNARLLALFQLLKIEWLAPETEDLNNKYRLTTLYQTEEGVALARLMDETPVAFWLPNSFADALSIVKFVMKKDGDRVAARLMDFWGRSVEAGRQTVELEVTVWDCVLSVIAGDQLTLEDLHDLIQEAVAFDNDHLYYFEIGTGTAKRRYYSPYCSDQRWLADEATLAELSLYKGMQFAYLFDFGDEWHFRITVKNVLPAHRDDAVAKIIKGEAPEQYPRCEDEW